MKGLKKYLDILKDLWTPVNAEDIRMAINNALELMGKNVDDNIDRQDELEGQFQDVLDETTNKDFNSAPEIRAARDGEANLKARLDAEHQKVTSQLAHTTYEKTYSRKSNPVRNIVSWALDDAYKTDYDLVLPLSIEKNVPFTVNVITRDGSERPDHFMTDEQLLSLQNDYGWEIQSHTVTHADLSTLSVSELHYELGTSKKNLEDIGLNVDGICYPEGKYNQLVMDVARRYYRGGYASIMDRNYSPLRTYRISRMNIDNMPLNQIKSIVDGMDNMWVIFYGHTRNWTQADIDRIGEAIDYIKSKNIDMMTQTKALDVYENRLEVGDQYQNNLNKRYLTVGADGTVDQFGSFHFLGNKNGTVNIDVNTPITNYPAFKVSLTTFTTEDNSGIPFSQGAGTLLTYRMSSNDLLSYQEFYGFNSTIPRRRNWTSNGWGEWVFTPQSFIIKQPFDFGTLASGNMTYEVPVENVTTEDVVSVNFTNGIAHGVIPFAYVKSNGIVEIKLHNVTQNSVTVGNRPIKISVQKPF